MTKRPLNSCNACGHTWYPRGSNLSRRCPDCKSPDVGLAPMVSTFQLAPTPKGLSSCDIAALIVVFILAAPCAMAFIAYFIWGEPT